MNYIDLKQHLLDYWFKQGIRYIYKYKERVKWDRCLEYQFDKMSNFELFLDFGSSVVFPEIPDRELDENKNLVYDLKQQCVINLESDK